MMQFLKQGLTFIFFAGLGLGLLRLFGGDPFAVMTWLIDWILHAIDTVADFFASNDSFKEVTKKPKG